MNPARLYRYEAHNDVSYAFSEEEVVKGVKGVKIELRTLPVIRQTKCGVWIRPQYGTAADERWVSLSGRKRYAYPTETEALNSFQIRNTRRIEHLERDLKLARVAREALKKDSLYAEVPSDILS